MHEAASYTYAWTALGWAVVHFVWQGAVIWLAAAAILQCLGRRSPGVRYAVACMAMCACLVVFVTSLFMFLEVETPSPDLAVVWMHGNVFTGVPALSLGPDIAGIAAYCWVIGLSWMMLRYAYQWIQAQRLRHQRISKPDAYWQDAFETLKSKLRIRQSVLLFRSGMAKTAMLVGCFRPVVLIPICAFTKLTPDQLRAVIAHELAHIRRLDPWVNLGQSVVEILLFFHPAVWWISRQVRIEREYCCDDLSVRASGSPRMLAEGLALLESLRVASPAASLAANGGSLLERIARLLGAAPVNTKQRGNDMVNKAIAVIAAAVLLIGGFCMVQAQEHTDESPKIEAKAFTVEDYMRAEREIRKLVADGKVSPEDAQTRLVEMRRAIADTDSGDRRQENLEAQNDRSDVEDYLDGVWTKLQQDVAAGSLSQEEARTKMAETEEAVRKRMEYAAMHDRIQAAVEAGEISEEDARERIEGMKRHWASRVERGEEQVRKEHADSISVQEYRAAEKKIRKLVEDGNVSAEDAEIRLREMRRMIRE